MIFCCCCWCNFKRLIISISTYFHSQEKSILSILQNISFFYSTKGRPYGFGMTWRWINYFLKICEPRSRPKDRVLTIFYSWSPRSGQFYTRSHWIHRCSFHGPHNHRYDLQKGLSDNNSHWYICYHHSVNIDQEFHLQKMNTITLVNLITDVNF